MKYGGEITSTTASAQAMQCDHCAEGGDGQRGKQWNRRQWSKHSQKIGNRALVLSSDAWRHDVHHDWLIWLLNFEVGKRAWILLLVVMMILMILMKRILWLNWNQDLIFMLWLYFDRLGFIHLISLLDDYRRTVVVILMIDDVGYVEMFMKLNKETLLMIINNQ